MALITAPKTLEKDKIKIEINSVTYAEIKKYCAWSGISEIDYFFEEAAHYILSKDKEWKQHQSSIKEETIK